MSVDRFAVPPYLEFSDDLFAFYYAYYYLLICIDYDIILLLGDFLAVAP